MYMKVFNFFLFFFIILSMSCNDDTFNNNGDKQDIDTVKIVSHPRILLKEGEEKNIKQLINNSEEFNNVHQYILNSSDKILDLEPVERVLEGKRLLAVSREALRRIYFLSYTYRMTEDKKYAERAKKELLSVCNFKDWNPQHFLDIAEMITGVAIGYDWLYDYLPDEIRKKIRNAIIEKGILPARNTKNSWFYNSESNWNQFCNSGLIIGALAIYEDQPQMAQETINKSLESINNYGMKVFEPDGAYPEGYTYWGGGTGFQVTMIEALLTALSNDYGMCNNINFMHSPYFMLLMMTPTGFCYNYGDSGTGVNLESAMFWFASKLKDESLLFHEYSHLLNLDKYLKNDVDRLLPNVLILSKNIDLNNMSSPKRNYWISEGVKPIYIYRGGWNSKDDVYLGIVGGAANVSHGHMDAGSFLFEKNQVRWAHELGLQSYSTLESKGVDLWNYSQTGQRWDVFRLGNRGHSTLIINDDKPNVNGAPQIIQTFETAEEKGAKLDLSSLFSNNLNKAIRKIILNRNNDLIVIDSVLTNSKHAKIRWQMVSQTDARIDGNGIVLFKNGHEMSLTVNITPKVDYKLMIWGNNKTDTNELHDYDQDNPGTCRVGFEIDEAAINTNYEFKVLLETIK